MTLASSSRMSAPCRPSVPHGKVVVLTSTSRAQRFQRQQVRVDAPPADAVAARAAADRLAEAAQHRAGEQHASRGSCWNSSGRWPLKRGVACAQAQGVAFIAHG